MLSEGSVTRGEYDERAETTRRWSEVRERERVEKGFRRFLMKTFHSLGWRIECRLIRHSFIIGKNTGHPRDGPGETRLTLVLPASSLPLSLPLSLSFSLSPRTRVDHSRPRSARAYSDRASIAYERLIHKTVCTFCSFRWALLGDPQGRWKR